MENTEKRLKSYSPQERYAATHTRRIVLKLNLKTDADILKAIADSPDPMQTTIKRWIRHCLSEGIQ